jgi:hypothetical protein
MLDCVGISADTDRLARAMFSPEQLPDHGLDAAD